MKKLERKVENDICHLIKGLVKSEYEKEGYNNVIPKVNVRSQKSISVMINTEEPFLGEEFWKLLSKLESEIDNAVKVFGFTYKKTEFMYDYCIINYEFKIE